MTEAEAVAAANDFAVGSGISLSDFHRPRLSFDQAGHIWSLWYWGKQNVVANYIIVEVEDASGEAKFIPSR